MNERKEAALRRAAAVLYNGHHSLAEVAGMLRRSTDTVRAWVIAEGCEIRKRGRSTQHQPLDPDTAREMHILREHGWSYRRIGEHMGCSASHANNTLSRWADWLEQDALEGSE